MFSEIAISISNVSKRYRIYDKPQDSLKQILLQPLQRYSKHTQKQYYHAFWALKNINIAIPKGQITGIIGKNGAGKSTLLQIICGTVAPSEGQVHIKGRVAALLELGSGFHADFTGIENIYINAQLLGLDKHFINTKIEDIKAFADIGDFINSPIKTYSSGMLARLAFSVAVHVEPDILIVDEALSVGDAWFQHKSMAKMKALMSNNCTVLFVSHSIDSVRALCDKVLWLEHGVVKRYGNTTDITNEYMNEVYLEHNRMIQNTIQPQTEIIALPSHLDGSAFVSIQQVRILNSQQVSTDKLHHNESFTLEIELTFLQNLPNISVGFLINDQFGQALTGESVFNAQKKGLHVKAGARLKLRFTSCMLFQGGQSYSIALRINQVSQWDRSDNLILYGNDLAMVFEVISNQDDPMWFKFKQKFDVEILNV